MNLTKFFHALNNYPKNIKLTIKLSPSKFLDTQLMNVEGKYIKTETALKNVYTEQKI